MSYADVKELCLVMEHTNEKEADNKFMKTTVGKGDLSWFGLKNHRALQIQIG